MSKFVHLKVSEYAAWLREHVAQGGKVTHAYNFAYSLHTNMMFRAVQDFRTGEEYGADAINILPAPGVRHLKGQLGHNVIFPLDGGRCSFVPAYTDTVFDDIPGVAQARARRAQEEREYEEKRLAYEAKRQAKMIDSDVPRRSRNW